MEKKSKKKIVLNVDPIKDPKNAKVMAKVLMELIKEKGEDSGVLINFKQVDGTNHTYEVPNEDNKSKAGKL